MATFHATAAERTPEEKALRAANERERRRAAAGTTPLAPCVVCGGPKERKANNRGQRKCDACWSVSPEKTLDELIAEQEHDLRQGSRQEPQRFGDRSKPESRVIPLRRDSGDRWDGEYEDPRAYSPWEDPVGEAVVSRLSGQ